MIKMGYYATINGYCNVCTTDIMREKEISLDELKEMFEDAFFGSCYFSDEEDYDETRDNLDVNLSGYDKYHEDDIFDLLEYIEPYTTVGEIEYSGDDDEHWRHIYDPVTQKWLEQPGSIVYDDTKSTGIKGANEKLKKLLYFETA